MSTRACYRFIPENGPNDWLGVVTVYKHHDGYPSGAALAIEKALDYAWKLPRFEADEFAAAFVAGNKTSVSSIRAQYEQHAIDAEKRANWTWSMPRPTWPVTTAASNKTQRPAAAFA